MPPNDFPDLHWLALLSSLHTYMISMLQETNMSENGQDKEEGQHEKTNCKVCKKEVYKTKIIMHITRNENCKKNYGGELDNLRNEQEVKWKEFQTKYQNEYQKLKKDVVTKKNANYYKKNADAICERNKKIRHAKKEMNRIIKKINKESCAEIENKETKIFQQNKETKKNYNTEVKNVIKIPCKACKKQVLSSKIVMHVKRNKGCEEIYGDELQILIKEKAEAKKIYLEKYKEIYNEENKEILKKKRALLYQEKKAKTLKNEVPVKKLAKEKAPYDPLKRKKKYKKEKETKETLRQRIFDAQKDDVEDELYENDEQVNRMLQREENESNYEKQWYQENKDRIKMGYDTSIRKEKLKKEQLSKAKMEKKIRETDADELMLDRKFHGFCNRERKKKEWYKNNSEEIKKKRKENYDPDKKKRQNEKQKEKREAEAEVQGDIKHIRFLVMWNHNDHGLDAKSRKYNSNSKINTHNRYRFGWNWLSTYDWDEECYLRLGVLKSQIGVIYQKFEAQINEVKEIALDFANNTQKSSGDIEALYKELHQKHCDNWHGFQKKMDEEFHAIANSFGTTFTCENNYEYCMKCECCAEYNYCLNHRNFTRNRCDAFEWNRFDEKRTRRVFQVGLANVKNLPLRKDQCEKIKDIEIKISAIHLTADIKVHNFYDTEGDEDRSSKSWTKSSCCKDISKDWRNLRMEIDTIFKEITESFGESFDPNAKCEHDELRYRYSKFCPSFSF